MAAKSHAAFCRGPGQLPRGAWERRPDTQPRGCGQEKRGVPSLRFQVATGELLNSLPTDTPNLQLHAEQFSLKQN